MRYTQIKQITQAKQGTKKAQKRTIWQGLNLRISVDMMYDPRLQIYCNSPFRLLSQALASHYYRPDVSTFDDRLK